MKRYALYTDAGEIVAIFTGTVESAAIQGYNFQECDAEVSDTTHYVHAGKICAKTSLDVHLSIEDLVATLSGIPEGSVIRAQGQEFEAAGDVELEFDRLGRYRVHVVPPPMYADTTVEVHLDA